MYITHHPAKKQFAIGVVDSKDNVSYRSTFPKKIVTEAGSRCWEQQPNSWNISANYCFV